MTMSGKQCLRIGLSPSKLNLFKLPEYVGAMHPSFEPLQPIPNISLNLLLLTLSRPTQTVTIVTNVISNANSYTC